MTFFILLSEQEIIQTYCKYRLVCREHQTHMNKLSLDYNSINLETGIQVIHGLNSCLISASQINNWNATSRASEIHGLLFDQFEWMLSDIATLCVDDVYYRSTSDFAIPSVCMIPYHFHTAKSKLADNISLLPFFLTVQC